MPEHPATTAGKGNSLAILLCRDLAKAGSGLDLKQLRLSLEGMVPGAAVEVVRDLCDDLRQIPTLVDRLVAERVVLGLCSGEFSQVELQSQAKKAGLDPFAVEAVPLGSLCAAPHTRTQATQKAQTLIIGAAAKLSAFRGSSPDNTKVRLLAGNQKVSRRALFTTRPVGYSPVPCIVKGRCASPAGCHACAAVCPKGALQKVGASITLDKAKCESCGICVVACPREAVDFPGWTLSQISAQLSAMLENAVASDEPVSIVFTCQKGAGRLEALGRRGLKHSHRWLPVGLPCLAMVTPDWILQALARGAGSVALFPCEPACTFGQQDIINGRVNYCQRILSMLGQPDDRVYSIDISQANTLLQVLAAEPPGGRDELSPTLKTPMSLGSTMETLGAIWNLWDTGFPLNEIALESPHSPFGVLELRDEACTGCLACISSCPTGALSSMDLDGGSEISLVPTACTGCGRCAEICPEKSAGVLRVTRATDLALLSRERIVLRRKEEPREAEAVCDACGRSIAPDALVQRVASILKENNHPLGDRLSRYCPACRASLAWAGRPSIDMSLPSSGRERKAAPEFTSGCSLLR